MYTYMYIHTCKHIHIYAHAHAYTYMYMHTCKHIHTHREANAHDLSARPSLRERLSVPPLEILRAPASVHFPMTGRPAAAFKSFETHPAGVPPAVPPRRQSSRVCDGSADDAGPRAWPRGATSVADDRAHSAGEVPVPVPVAVRRDRGTCGLP